MFCIAGFFVCETHSAHTQQPKWFTGAATGGERTVLGACNGTVLFGRVGAEGLQGQIPYL